MKAETDELNNATVRTFRSGEPPTSEAAMNAAEAHREHIDRRFYDCDQTFHKGLADLYVSDSRYTANYDEALKAPGLAQYVHDAMYANAARSHFVASPGVHRPKAVFAPVGVSVLRIVARMQ